MKQKYVKMNNNQRHLSLGNFSRIVKEISLNKTFASQTEIFFGLFGVDDVSDSTINNYCIGYRSIGTDFKQIYIKRKKYPNREFDETMISLLSILKGQIQSYKTHEDVIKLTKDELFKKLCLELYNLAKNDEDVTAEFTSNIYNLIREEKLYECMCEFLLYIVLEKSQPIYVSKTQRELFESILNNTNISMNDLESFLKVQMQDGINYTYSLKKLSKEGNPYASFELGDMEYKGIMSGFPRYVKAYEYFLISAGKNHPRAHWLVARMLLEGKIGNQTKEDLEKGFNHLIGAEKLGSIAAVNSIGLCYLNGICVDKDKEKAKKYFESAASNDYVYAHNNLGKIYEEEGNLEKAFNHYLFSSSLEESWACNKMGMWYKDGIYVDKDLKKSYEYFNKALNVPMNILNFWAYFNLAKYFYLDGNFEAGVEKNLNKAVDYFELCLSHIDDAYLELINIYIDKYEIERKQIYLDKVNEYLDYLSLKPDYEKYSKKIGKKLSNLIKEKIIIVKNI